MESIEERAREYAESEDLIRGTEEFKYCQRDYIDIYETVDYKKNNMEKSVEMEENSAKELHRLISTVLGQPESKDTRVMVEKSNGELIPVSYVWYDRQQDIIRISYEEDEE